MRTNNLEPFDIQQMEERQEAASHGSVKVQIDTHKDPTIMVGGTIYPKIRKQSQWQSQLQ